ncbi:MAG TPA: DUF5916 domain-containing protein [Gemmatimonadaceae bacterium]|nr:DUF5916 domain-containing protein [Gemmatimonadaceae bacterium]
MLLLALLAASLEPGPVHNGRARELAVSPPRLEETVTIDGHLNEDPWSRAAVLTGFSRYAPTDGVAADDSTHVLVWYSPTAIHFGIRAFAAPGAVNATLADRDRIYNDDYIGIFLGTFNDGRQATVFAVNPLGVQGDGIVVERGASSGGGFSGIVTGREPTDIAPDYVFQSRGRVTEFGYEVEIRIPFKSLRYQAVPTQTWGINVIRKAQSRGYEYSWAPAERAAASYIGQFGTLEGLTGLERGLVLDVNPVFTARALGVRNAATGAMDRQSVEDVGGNVRLGITNDWTLNGTINPDFAEVESDAGQIVNDPRRALFFAERRPFFLDAIEQFTVPNQLIYTRRIADPLTAAKVTGRRSGTSVAWLAALDDRALSFTGGERPFYNLLRVQRDVGRSSRVGMVYTDRIDGDFSNRVLGVDGRLIWRTSNSAQFQLAGSRTGSPGAEVTGTAFQLDLRHTGRVFNARWRLNALHDDFHAQSGYINRPAIANALLSHSYTLYGGEGAMVESANLNLVLDGTWKYQRFVHGDDMLEKKLQFNQNFVLRGGWQAGASVLVETFGYDPDLYTDLYVERASAGGSVTYEPFVGRPWIPNLDYVLTLTSPSFRRFSAHAMYVWGRDENFYEWTSADIYWISASLTFRPSEQLRLVTSWNEQSYARRSDGTTVARTRIPRLRAEYQITRSIFVRAVAEYRADFADDLRESDRSGDPLYRQTASGLVRARGFTTADRRANHLNFLRPELLFSYLPTPGTVIYAGYGATMVEPEPFGLGRGDSQLRRQSDALFVKLGYLFRM